MSRGLSRDRVIAAAISYIQAHGVQALTMRRVGASLGVEAMALYRYVGGRDELLGAVVNTLINDVLDDLDSGDEDQTWEEYLQRVGHSMRALALEHPKSFPLIATRPPRAPWLRPPLRSVRWVEHFLSVLLEHGFSEAGAVQAYKSFTGFLLGHLLLEAAERGGEVSPAGDMGEDSAADEGAESGEGSDDPLAEFPTVRQLRSLLEANRSEREFEDGLEDLIERLRHTDDQ